MRVRFRQCLPRLWILRQLWVKSSLQHNQCSMGRQCRLSQYGLLRTPVLWIHYRQLSTPVHHYSTTSYNNIQLSAIKIKVSVSVSVFVSLVSSHLCVISVPFLCHQCFIFVLSVFCLCVMSVSSLCYQCSIVVLLVFRLCVISVLSLCDQCSVFV